MAPGKDRFSNGIPVFTGKMLKPKSGATVKATDLITALTMQMGANASSTAAKLTDENKVSGRHLPVRHSPMK